MGRQIALLRGINLGPHRRVAMGDLRSLLAEAGYADVRTHLQSGNVVLTSDTAPDDLARDLERRIATGLGVDAGVVVRTRDELADVVARDPLRGVVDDPRRYQVTFRSGEPEPDAVRELERVAVAPERIVVSGREIYAWHPNGIGRSELAAELARARFGVTATARNWNTVTKLLELADDAG
ncbi:MAG TPA: DUF1697 domain-containing protein [Solirubrobacteraceae bacterium]|nr:DUF1697 domain-containing protein [Solirubrobacteraceae bacterium]